MWVINGLKFYTLSTWNSSTNLTGFIPQFGVPQGPFLALISSGLLGKQPINKGRIWLLQASPRNTYLTALSWRKMFLKKYLLLHWFLIKSMLAVWNYSVPWWYYINSLVFASHATYNVIELGNLFVQIMACCLIEPSHCLNQWWLQRGSVAFT